jgi:hypothetical protein
MYSCRCRCSPVDPAEEFDPGFSQIISPLFWTVLICASWLFVVGTLCGCSATYIEKRANGDFVGWNTRVGWDAKIARFDFAQNPTTTRATLEGYESSPNTDMVRAAAEGATAGAVKAVRP